MLAEFDMDAALRISREDGYLDGREDGYLKGQKAGYLRKGEELLSLINRGCTMDDLKRYLGGSGE